MKRFIPLFALPLVTAFSFLCSATKVDYSQSSKGRDSSCDSKDAPQLNNSCLDPALKSQDCGKSAVQAPSEPVKAVASEPQDIVKISKAFGHMIGQNLESLGLDFDMKAVMQGIQDCMNGSPSPMTEAECIQAISLIQDNAFQKQSQDNLRKAEDFLAKNKVTAGIVEVDSGKLQYIVLQAGTGKEVEPGFSPVIRYSGKFLDGKVFGESHEDEVISLDETIEGFKKGIVGMKEGEKRRIFIHPEFGYGTTGFLPPNSLLAFDIEVVKANAPKTDAATVSMDTHSEAAVE